MDAWLYETCTQCLQHMVDIVVQFYPVVQPLLTRILDLLSNFIRWAAGRLMIVIEWASLPAKTQRKNLAEVPVLLDIMSRSTVEGGQVLGIQRLLLFHDAWMSTRLLFVAAPSFEESGSAHSLSSGTAAWQAAPSESGCGWGSGAGEVGDLCRRLHERTGEQYLRAVPMPAVQRRMLCAMLTCNSVCCF